MRIISGIYGGRLIKSPADSKTRPTSDRLRETLFNILNSYIGGETRFLDLCAGTGAVGIEAVSRGAGFATFIDKSRRACALIEENLDLLQVSEDATEIHCFSAEVFAARPHAAGWNIIFYDPPYQTDYLPVLREAASGESGMLSGDGIFIAEHHFKNSLPDLVGELRRWRIVKQGETNLSFYEKS